MDAPGYEYQDADKKASGTTNYNKFKSFMNSIPQQ